MFRDPKTIMISYMEDKYGEKFEFVSIGSEPRFAGFREMRVTSENLPGQVITVHMSVRTRVVSDNYIMFLMQEQFQSFVQKIAEGVYGECQVFTPVTTRNGALMPRNIGKDISFEDYLKAVNGVMDIIVFTGKDDFMKEEDIEKLRKAFEAIELSVAIIVRYVKDPSVIGDIRREMYLDSFWYDDNVVLQGFFIMDENFQFRTERWREIL